MIGVGSEVKKTIFLSGVKMPLKTLSIKKPIEADENRQFSFDFKHDAYVTLSASNN